DDRGGNRPDPRRGAVATFAGGHPPHGEGGRALEPLPARRRARRGAHELGIWDAGRADGAEPRGLDGLQLRRPRYREHGDPRRVRYTRAEEAVARAAPRGRDPELLLDDRTRGVRLRSDAAAHADRKSTRL